MKLGTIIGIAALGMAMTLGASVNPADAGQKGKRAHQGGSSGKVHIDPHVSSKNLRELSHKLKGHQKQAVQHEIKRREDILSDRKAAEAAGEWIGGSVDIQDHIVGLGLAGSVFGKKKRNH